MPSYRVPGSRSEAPLTSTAAKSDYLGVVATPYLATRADATRGRNETTESPKTDHDDVVKIMLDNGIELWTSVERAKQDYGGAAAAREGGPALLVPHVLPIGRASRGVGDWIVKGIELFQVQLTDVAARKVVRALEEKFEAKLGLGGPGLYRFGRDAKPQAVKDLAKEMAAGPSLIFIHGTASCSEAGFGMFTERPAWNELFARYQDRVFAYEHRTLSEGPIENVLALAKLLPKGAEIDLVSHSRGGLVAELLCRSARVDANGLAVPAFDGTDKLIFRKTREESGVAGPKDELKGLDGLNAEFAKKAFKVRQLVRAGCPARGTTLASKRLDIYLSLVVNAMKLIPALSTSLVFEFTMGLLLAVAKLRTDPEEVPGLEAQMPESPLIRMVNRPDITLSNRLSVISGDIKGGGVWGRLKVLATDLFYLEDHDLVVNTSAMYGGARRAAGAYMFDEGTEVNHFSYFGNDKTAKGIADALNPDIASPGGFKPLDDMIREGRRSRAAAREAKRPGTAPVVYVLPGVMGSKLDSGKSLVWLNPVRIAFGDIDKIGWGEPEVTTAGVFGDYYGELVEFLSKTHEVVEFDYDWRKPLAVESKRLADAVLKKLKETSQPFRFVGHSMGGLVVRTMAARHTALWEQIMLNPGARFLMLGAPNMGAFSTVGLLMGRDRTIKQLEALDFEHNMKELLEIVSGFPGGLELLPRDKNAELYDFDIWQKILKYEPKAKWAGKAKTRLEDADEIWKTLEATPLTGNLAYVAGTSNELTPSGIRFEPEKNKVTMLGTRRGDGRVTYATGIPPGVPAWYAEAAHGDLARHEKSFEAYLDILATGKTTRLADKPRALARDAPAELEEIREPQIEIFPDTRDLTDAIMGAGPEPKAVTAERIKVKVRVVHGNLAFAHYPVAVGHYEGDTIRGAEAALDFHLGRRLNRKRSLDLYPGRVESAEVILNEDGRPSGALIIGLGPFGALTPGSLRRSYAYGLRKYADILADGTSGAQELKLSTLLIGHRESGITLRDAVAAMMLGLIDAKIRLRHTGGFDQIKVAELEIVELYEDTAIAAMQVMSALSGDQRISKELEFDPKLGAIEGKRRRIAPADDSGWARKIQIRGVDTDGLKGSMKFTVLDGSARATEVPLATQTTLINPYLKSLTGSTATDKRVSATLFELLTPKEFKLHAADDRDVELILDEVSAAYPWELLDDRLGAQDAPMAVRASCIRRFVDAKPGYSATLSRERIAVVIGDSVSGPASGFAPLDGAVKEADAVAELLESGGEAFEVTKIVRGPCARIVDALLTSGARVIHIATHGVFEMPRKAPDGAEDMVTGMVLGDGAFFTASEVGQIRPFPELVFLNCCHLGNMAAVTDAGSKAWNERHRLASNLALQFIQTGAKAVIAAGWAVDDKAAVDFAREFYSQMMAGATFSRAVSSARRAAFDRHPTCNTWGAYQCYGDSDYRLVSRQAAATARGRTLYSQTEAAIELENFAAEAATGSSERLEATREQIKGVIELIEPWKDKSSVQEGLAIAYGKVDVLDEAVAAYESSLGGGDSASSLRAIEQLANFRVKLAAARLRGAEGKERERIRREVVPVLKAAIRQIVTLQDAVVRSGLKSAGTVERHGLIGSAWKRIGAAEQGQKRLDAFKKAADAYREAYVIALQPNCPEPAYWPGLNVLLLEALENLNRVRTKRQPLSDTQAAMLKYCREQAESEERENPNFYALNAQFDAMIVERLMIGKLQGGADAAIDLFKRAWKRGGSHLQHRAVMEQLEFIEECLIGIEDWPTADDNLRNGIRTIRAAVEAAVKR